VLVVDDERPIREIERRILEKAGYHIIEASSAAEAFATLKDGKPIDLLIADLDMPELSGMKWSDKSARCGPTSKCCM